MVISESSQLKNQQYKLSFTDAFEDVKRILQGDSILSLFYH